VSPTVEFASPRRLPRANRLAGRVVVIDIAFASEGLGKGFAQTTGKFIQTLGPRLARWVDHHDHPRHADFLSDPRFVLATKQEHGACPEMITPELVVETGPVDTILAHFDLDGIFAAAKWILGGHEPYRGADDDARVVDTRIGTASARATKIDFALRAHFRDAKLKQQVVRYLVGGCQQGPDFEAIDAAAGDYARMAAQSRHLAQEYKVEGQLAIVHIGSLDTRPFDKTELLLIGQERATVSLVVDEANVTIAAPFDSGLNFVELFELGGGMPTRVNIPVKRLPEALALLHRRLDSSL